MYKPDYLKFVPGFQPSHWGRCLQWSGCMSLWPSTPGLAAVVDTLWGVTSAAHLHFVLPDEHYIQVPLHNSTVLDNWIHTL